MGIKKKKSSRNRRRLRETVRSRPVLIFTRFFTVRCAVDQNLKEEKNRVWKTKNYYYYLFFSLNIDVCLRTERTPENSLRRNARTNVILEKNNNNKTRKRIPENWSRIVQLDVPALVHISIQRRLIFFDPRPRREFIYFFVF